MISKIQFTVMMLIICFVSTISATNVNGRFVINILPDSTKLSVLLQLNTNTGNEGMGGATIVVKFDTSNIFFKCDPVKNVDYVFHNFCGGSYSAATITRPKCNLIWFNIDLPYNSEGNGIVVAQQDEWTDVATVYFDVLNPQIPVGFAWETNSPFWSIYSDDNQTVWNVGEFENQMNFIIPVELTSFNAKLLNDNSVQLKWTTATSINNLGFEVQKSQSQPSYQQNGSLDNWERLDFISSTGEPTEPKEYNYIDKTGHKSTTVKYRLKIIDLDGTYSFSDVIEVETKPLNFQLLQNYPNPFNPSTMIKWYSPVSSHQTLKVFDVLGNEVATLVDEFRDAGNYEMSFDADNLPANRQSLASGMYIYRLTTDNYTETRKMLLIR